ncbi:Ti-type conjugative transfer relaxase TraA [Burkholderia cenocepacia]|uniref:Ti-type conjugative transfer relaxase TraA n=1 Tax=Burkholderia cenocepacia TaxID=95486 RepID=UPI001AA18A2F|nr:Ti-type conjugative transfer relaxase TraA [Burkholderia cenocepacia]MBO1859316.1 Ti-type conjugative transfer relaxase TraA [Burkholderia cenocepacia]
MAIYHLNTHTIGRAAGHSAVAAAAYRSASKLVDERTGEVFDFTRKGGVLSAEIVTPAGVPVPERGALWNAAEAAEKRKDARVAREWRAALPHELNEADRRELATRMGQAIADRYGVAVDVCIHAPDREGDERNFHVHMLATTRTIGADGTLGAKAVIELANKDRQKAGIPGTSQGDITDIRREWAELTNEALERAGISARVDHRSYADQGIELTPTRHIGTDAVAMQRRGLEGVERIDLHNADRQEQARQITERPEIILDKITATQAVFSRREIAAELNRYIDDAEQFQALLAKLENSPRLIELEPAIGRHPAKFSTREMIDTERAMVASAERLAGSGKHGVSTAIVNAAIDGVGTLSDEQKNAVRHVTQAGSLAVVIGDAGTGKSFSMKVAREAWEAAGYNVRGAALAGKAADELQAGSGIDSRTLASLEFAWKNGKDKLTSRDVLVIDEAGMIGSRQLGRVLKAAEQAGAKVVLLGDDKQLAAIEAGAAFRGVVQHVGAAEITEVRRQKEAWARAAGQELARGSVADGLAAYAERGHVKIHDSREAARDALAAAYVADQGTGSQIILAHSNADVQALNEAVREARKERGELAGIARFMTERGGREFAQGDRLVFLRNDRELDVKNGTLGTVERAEDGRLAVRLDSGEMREFSAEQYAAVDHGYAVTIHKAQGVTVDRAYLLATPGMDRSLAYVGMTRHREAATLFAGADDFTDRRAGRLVDHGAAHYEHDPKNGLSYFATLENDKGERHTIWGVDLERAIADSGAQIGDRIGLAHGGAQTVRLPDGRMVERNTWHVRTAPELAAGKLAQVLGRERPKESTLDFADRRGFDGESVVRRWIERGRAKVAELAGKMRDGLRRNLERHGRPDLMPATDIAGTPTMQRPQQIERAPEDEKKRRAAEIAAKFRQQVAQERGEQAAPQRPQVERPAPDPLAGFRAGVERAEAAGGGLALDVAKAQLAVAQEFQAAGKDPRHHAAAIMQEGQRRAFAGLSQPSQAKAEPERPAAVQVSEQDRKRAELAARQEVGQFKALAVKRQAGFAGYTDRNPSAWRELPAELRERIERFNAMPKERQAVELDKMQRELADRYARNPQEITRSRQRQREQERGRDGFSR